MTVACIVQARLNSKRLPGKAMLSLGGEPVIRHVLRRCKEIPGVDTVVCAIPEGSDPIAREAAELGCDVFPGSELDVLARYYGAAKMVGADVIVRVTGDCPLIDPVICGRVLALMKDGVDYASNTMPRGYADGLDCEAFTFEALDRAHKAANDPYDREHVTSFMQRNLHCVNWYGDGDPNERLTLDTLDDYLKLSEIFHAVG